jgi:hypothetical protein
MVLQQTCNVLLDHSVSQCTVHIRARHAVCQTILLVPVPSFVKFVIDCEAFPCYLLILTEQV